MGGPPGWVACCQMISPMVGRMWALSRDTRPSIVRGCLPRSMLSLRYSSPSIRIVREARTSAPAGVACSLSSAASAWAKILRASSSELARRSTRFHGLPSPAGALKYTWYLLLPGAGA